MQDRKKAQLYGTFYEQMADKNNVDEPLEQELVESPPQKITIFTWLRKMFRFRGRSSRREFVKSLLGMGVFAFILFTILSVLFLFLLLSFLPGAPAEPPAEPSFAMLRAMVFGGLFFFLPLPLYLLFGCAMLSLASRRFHDIGWSSFWAWVWCGILFFSPFYIEDLPVGFVHIMKVVIMLGFLILLFYPSQRGRNKYDQ